METIKLVSEGVDERVAVYALKRQWLLDHSQNLEELWAAMDECDLADERIPYWAELWPSSLAVARILEERQKELRQGPCLDLGCGCGFTAIIGRALGARVFACDYLRDALLCARKNACINGVYPQFLGVDWRAPAIAPGRVWRLWAADIVYERRAFEPVLDFLGQTLHSAGVAWIGEPGRKIFEDFLQLARAKHWRIECILRQSVNDIHAKNIPVAVWQLCRS